MCHFCIGNKPAMKLLVLLISTIILTVNYSQGSRIFPKKLLRSKRCVCLTITTPICSCFSSQLTPQQIYRQEEAPAGTSTIVPTSTFSPVTTYTPSQCFPNCLQNCMQNQYSRCKQSCQNTCYSEQQQQQVPQYTAMQYEPVSKVQQYEPIAVIGTSSPATVVQQTPTSGTIECILQACMPSCQVPCAQQRSTASVPQQVLPYTAVQHEPIPSAQHYQPSTPIPVVQQRLPSVFPTVVQSTTSVPLQNQPMVQQQQYLPSQAICIALCMPSCQSQCIQQTTAVPVTVTYPTSAVVPTQIYPTAATQTSVPVVPTISQSPSCMYQCQGSCTQQCVEQGQPIVQCRAGCVSSCENSCSSSNLQLPWNPPLSTVQAQQQLQPVVQPAQNSGYQQRNCQTVVPALTICICPSGYQRCSERCCRMK